MAAQVMVAADLHPGGRASRGVRRNVTLYRFRVGQVGAGSGDGDDRRNGTGAQSGGDGGECQGIVGTRMESVPSL